MLLAPHDYPLPPGYSVTPASSDAPDAMATATAPKKKNIKKRCIDESSPSSTGKPVNTKAQSCLSPLPQPKGIQ